MDENTEKPTPPVKSSSSDALDSDIVMLTGTVPEIIVSSSSDNTCSVKTEDTKVADIKIKQELLNPEEGQVDAKSDEEHIYDFVVLDEDDYSSQPPVKGIKLEKNSELAIKQEPVSDAVVLFNPGMKIPKKEIKKECPKIKPEGNMKEPKVSITVSKISDDPLNRNSEISANTLLNATVVLQLDATDLLDSYLDTTVVETPAEKGSKDITDRPVEVAPVKAVEADSLILTADEELETEMTLTDKNEKIQDTNVEEKLNEAFMEENTFTKEAPSVENMSKDDSTDAKKDPSTTSVDKPETKIETKTTTDAPEKIADNKNDAKKSSSGGRISDLHGSSRIIWISNVTQSVKATDLKQYISKVGKVMTAKVVTDGKKCYGYVVMDKPDDASECLRTLNNAYFEGKKISLSFIRPPKSIPDKKDGIKSDGILSKSSPKERTSRHNLFNETDDTKVSKEHSKPPKRDSRKRHGSPSQSRSSTKRQNSRDPLTTKFGATRRNRREYRQRSRSNDRRREYYRERMERDRLKRRLIEEERKNREEMVRSMQREEKRRDMEFRLEHDRRKLQLERELFERERRELTRIDAERRKIEMERLELLQQRNKIMQDMQKIRLPTKTDEFNLCSAIVKPTESIKTYEQRKDVPKLGDNYRKQSDSKHQFQKQNKDLRDDRKLVNDVKNSSQKRNDFKTGKDANSKGLKRGDDFKTYERSAPPPPKLSNEFDLSDGRKTKHSDHRHEHCDRKADRGRKIEVVERKFYPERGNDDSDRRSERMYRKPEFAERKFDYGREVKRFREDGYPERDNTQRTPWSAPVNYNDPWKPALSNAAAAVSSPGRYQEGNFSTPAYGGPSRIPPFYYHPTPPVQDYPRYDHCVQATGRKY